jgi:hypothetical protein
MVILSPVEVVIQRMVRVHIIPVYEMEPTMMIHYHVRVCSHEGEEFSFVIEHPLKDSLIKIIK